MEKNDDFEAIFNVLDNFFKSGVKLDKFPYAKFINSSYKEIDNLTKYLSITKICEILEDRYKVSVSQHTFSNSLRRCKLRGNSKQIKSVEKTEFNKENVNDLPKDYEWIKQYNLKEFTLNMIFEEGITQEEFEDLNLVLTDALGLQQKLRTYFDNRATLKKRNEFFDKG